MSINIILKFINILYINMEYEVSFFDFDYKKIVKNIKKKGKKIHSFYPFQISYFYLSGESNFDRGFVRIRDEYPGKVTITTKILSGKYPEEYETLVNTNYDDTVKILEKAGLNKVLTSIKLREKWSFDKCHEVVFDLWPGLPLVMEIDCSTKKDLYNGIEFLNLDSKKSFTISKYEYLYGIPKTITQSFKNLDFKNYKKLLKNKIKKNILTFNKISKKYYLNFMTKKNQNKYKKIF